SRRAEGRWWSCAWSGVVAAQQRRTTGGENLHLDLVIRQRRRAAYFDTLVVARIAAEQRAVRHGPLLDQDAQRGANEAAAAGHALAFAERAQLPRPLLDDGGRQVARALRRRRPTAPRVREDVKIGERQRREQLSAGGELLVGFSRKPGDDIGPDRRIGKPGAD